MSWGMVAVAGASLVGGAMSSKAAKSAANTQADAANRATELQKEMFDKQIELQEPFRQAGLSAQNRLMYLLGLPQVAGSTATTTAPQASPAPAVAPASIDRNAIRSELLPKYTQTVQPQVAKPAAPAGGSGWTIDMAGPGMGGENYAESYFSNPAQATPTTTVDEAALNAAIDQRMAEMQAQQAAQQQAISAQINGQTPTDAGNFTQPGSLMAPFGQSQYEADAAPKPGDFTMADFQADPGYAFRLNEGTNALTRAYAGRGSFLSGSALKGITNYAQGAASQEYGNAFNRFQVNRTNKVNDYKDAYNRFQINRSNVMNPLQAIMGSGQTATGQQAQSAANFGSQAGSNIMGAGNASAAGQVGAANAMNNALSQVSNNYFQNQMMDRLFQPGGSTSYGAWNQSPMSRLLYSNGSLGD